MRLINVNTLEIREFVSDIPQYVILSHRWTDDEIDYKDFVKGRKTDSRGYDKVEKFCEWIKQNPFHTGWAGPDKLYLYHAQEWAWIDTVCIDRRSSAELSEAINSMWRWYEEAEYCVAYLEDVDDSNEAAAHKRYMSSLRKSEWFTRGWTLQELLAPAFVIFCNARWENIGAREDERIAPVIERATGISRVYLKDYEARHYGRMNLAIRHISVAAKLSWASNRRTSRDEDAAYSLLGLLGVNMPLLYGEGRFRAFQRLQEEFIRRYDDESIFCFDTGPTNGLSAPGALAARLEDFEECGNVQLIDSDDHAYIIRSPYFMTNKGLRMGARAVLVPNPNPNPDPARAPGDVLDAFNAEAFHDARRTREYLYLVPLNCRNAGGSLRHSNWLKRLDGQYVMVVVADAIGQTTRVYSEALPRYVDDMWFGGDHTQNDFFIKCVDVSLTRFTRLRMSH